MTPCVQATRTLRHSISSLSQFGPHRSHSLPRICIHTNNSDAPCHPRASPFGDFSSAQGNCDNRSSLISVTVTQIRSQIFPHVHNVSCPPAWVGMNRGGFPVCNPNNQASVIATVTTNRYVQLRGSCSYNPLPCTQIRSINMPPPTRAGIRTLDPSSSS